jgi:23S rRNA (uracil1939-C5)-methyltransferase
MYPKDSPPQVRRFDILCPHFKVCSGCVINVEVNKLSLLHEARDFFASQGLKDVPFHVGSVIGWRCRAKLAIRGTAQYPFVGLFRKGSHDVVPIPSCRIHHPAINIAVEHLKAWIKDSGIEPYDEARGCGALRYAQCVVERSSQKVQLSLVLNAPDSDKLLWMDKTRPLWKEGGPLWHSLWLNFNQRRDNVIFGMEWHLIQGHSLLWEKLAGVDVCFQPASFAQANLDQFECILHSIRRHLAQGAQVEELYAGVGAIGLAISDKCSWVRCSDLNPAGYACFEESKHKLPTHVQERISWQQGDASKDVHLLQGANVVIVDPPRSGLHASLLQAMQGAPELRQLVYVSCGWPSFKRDCLQLSHQGWSLKDAEMHLLFPGSEHIETVAFFEKTYE